MKTKEELNAIKEEVEAVSKELRALSDEKLKELTEEELGQVTGGMPDLNREKEIGIGVDVSPIRMSGVDIEEIYLNLIRHQNASQSNSRVITPSDILLEENH